MMKKLLAIILIFTMAASLAACGSDSNIESAPASSAVSTVQNESETVDNEDAGAAYLENMSEFITNFESLSAEVGQMMNGYDGSEEWYTAFATVYKSISNASTSLADVVGEVPEDYQESHAKIAVAVAAYADMMDSFGSAVDAYQAGDEATGDKLMGSASELYDAAVQLWSEAVA